MFIRYCFARPVDLLSSGPHLFMNKWLVFLLSAHNDTRLVIRVHTRLRRNNRVPDRSVAVENVMLQKIFRGKGLYTNYNWYYISEIREMFSKV